MTGPAMSVVFVTAENDDTTLAAMLAALGRQTIHEAIEVVVVAQDGVAVDLAGPLSARFFSVVLARCDPQALLGTALAIGARRASAPIVALIEDHCTPDPDWAEALLERHADGFAVVGSEIRNANPDSSLSWSNFILTHSGWAQPAVAGEVDAVAGDNCSYLRHALLEAGAELDLLLASGTVLHWQMCGAGYRVYLEPAAKLAHVTPSRFTSYIGSFFHSARVFAALWSRHWSGTRRAWHAAVSPLIACRWVTGLVPRATKERVGDRVIRVRLLMLMAIPFCGAGYVVGYLCGAGTSLRYTSDIYFHRHAHLRGADQSAVESFRASRG